MVWVRRLGWTGSRTKEGHREYELMSLVRLDNLNDGPYTVFNAPGVVAVGATWNFGNDLDSWAYCTPEARATPRLRTEKGRYWELKQKFTTKADQERCQDQEIDDPLQEPQKISGSFIRDRIKTEKDKDGKRMTYSNNFEGIQIERDKSYPSIIIEQNVATLGLDTFSSMVDTLNDATLWGLGSRKIKLSNVSWHRKLYGLCSYYYTRRLEFEVNFDGWDYTDIVQKGRMCLKGDWTSDGADPPNYTWNEDTGLDSEDQGDYMLALDPKDNPEETLLNASGGRLTDLANPVFVTPAPKVYDESNMLSLGIPVTL